MWNSETIGTKTGLVGSLVKALRERLPPSWRLEEIRRQGSRNEIQPDVVVRLRGPDGTNSDVVLEVRKRVDPKEVPAVLDQARRLAKGRVIWIAAPFLGPRTRERLKQEGVGYADSTGNMWLALEKPALFITNPGSDRDPRAATRSLTSLKGRAAGRVVRALCDFRPPYGIRELAERSKSSLASVARVSALLDREAVIVRNKSGGIVDVDPVAVIHRWTQDYSLLKSNRARSLLEPRDLNALLGKLEKFQATYAVTGSLAAATRTAAPPTRLAVVYVDEVDMAAIELKLKPVDAGANVFLVRPYDSVVYERGFKLRGVEYAAVSQVAADLLTSPGRGPAEGEELLVWMKGNPGEWRI